MTTVNVNPDDPQRDDTDRDADRPVNVEHADTVTGPAVQRHRDHNDAESADTDNGGDTSDTSGFDPDRPVGAPAVDSGDDSGRAVVTDHETVDRVRDVQLPDDDDPSNR